MSDETVEEFLARGGKVSKSSETDISLDELLKKEGVLDEKGAKAIAALISSSISEGLDKEFNSTEEE